MKCHCDDEIQQREEVQRQVAKAAAECDGWRKKFEQDALVRIEELESTKVSDVLGDVSFKANNGKHDCLGIIIMFSAAMIYKMDIFLFRSSFSPGWRRLNQL